jgi:hypothetical protein
MPIYCAASISVKISTVSFCKLLLIMITSIIQIQVDELKHSIAKYSLNSGVFPRDFPDINYFT